MKNKIPHRGILILIALIFLLFMISSVLIRKELIKGEKEYKNYFSKLELLNNIRSTLAHLSMWQLTYIIEDNEREKFLSRRRMDKIRGNLKQTVDSLSYLGISDSLSLERLRISINQLIEVNTQIINKEAKDIDSLLLESMQIDFRSIHDIVLFHVSTVQEMIIYEENIESKDRYIGIILLLSIEIAIVLIIVLIVYVTLNLRKKAEIRLIEAEGYFNDVVNSMPSALIGTDNNGSVKRINKTAFMLCEINDWIDQPIEKCFPFLENCIVDLKKSILKSEQFNRKENYRNDARDKLIYDIKSFPLSSSNRKGAVVRIDDITQQEDMEDQLRQTQKMNAIGQLAGGVAHDFNNTLGAILGAAEYIRSGCNDEEKEEFLDIIINSSNKASNLTKKLLTFARKNNQRRETINLHDVITSSIALLEHSINKRVSINKNLQADTFYIKGDFSELQNVILNIGINAEHAMPDGGAITISTEIIDLDEEEKKSLPFDVAEGRYLAIEISDTGIGINESDLNRIFEPFYTTKEHGTGIGLASVYGIIQQHLGTVKVSSIVNEGTTFTIYFPVLETEEEIKSKNEDVMIHGEGTILIIDDEEMIRRSLQLILKKLGYKTLFAENGRAGIEVFKQYREEIKLIILDMIMPVMDGREALEEIRMIDGNVPVILSSGYAHSDDIYRAKDLNIQGVLPKPYSGLKLSKIVSGAIKTASIN